MQSEIETTPPPAYFGSLTIENIKCFKGEQTIDLSDGNDKPAMWTVILGNNNTGKTTLLRCLADLEPIKPHESLPYALKYMSKQNVEFFGKNNFSVACVLLSANKSIKIDFDADSCAAIDDNVKHLKIYGYGTSRKMGDSSLSETENQDNTASLFNDNTTLTNAEEWLLRTFFAEKLNKPKAAETLARIKKVLISGILPDVQDFDFDTTNNFQGFVKVKIDYGWVKLRELGDGYRVTLAWIVDLAKKLFERYPNSENPLHESAIVLIDELDLHLHPDWQRKIIKFLSEQFPRTQFIVTTHSPLIVQSADNINLVMLEKQDDHVIIKQRTDIKTFKGWTVDEILTELMGMDNKTLSDDYLTWMHQFDDALDEDNYHNAKQAYDELDKILHPESHQRKLLRIQMSSLMAE